MVKTSSATSTPPPSTKGTLFGFFKRASESAATTPSNAAPAAPLESASHSTPASAKTLPPLASSSALSESRQPGSLAATTPVAPLVLIDENEEVEVEMPETVPVKKEEVSLKRPDPPAARTPTPTKRARVVSKIVSDETEEEDEDSDSSASSGSSSSDSSSPEDEESEDDDESVVEPVRKRVKATPTKTTPPPARRPAAASTPPATPPNTEEGEGGSNVGLGGSSRAGEHEHNFLTWYTGKNRRDARMRTPDHPEYDYTTLHVPAGYISGTSEVDTAPNVRNRKVTEAMRVWWDFHSKYTDCVLAFKVGKFFELYHTCADIAVKACGLVYMRGETAHCGFPEKSWARMVPLLIRAGYRVARVEQTETPEQAKARTGKTMVRRELCQILSPGTVTMGVRETIGLYASTNTSTAANGATQLLGIVEDGERFHVCWMDPTTGLFRIGTLGGKEELKAALACESPAEICYHRSNLSEEIQTHLRTLEVMTTEIVPGARIKGLTAEGLRETYFSSAKEIPEVLKACVESGEKTVEAFGAVLAVIKRALIDDELISLGRFQVYASPLAPRLQSAEGEDAGLVLDAQALSHLDILVNSQDGTRSGSLIEYMDRTQSPHGQRWFRAWIARPLASVRAIRARQVLVEHLMRVNTSHLKSALSKSVDLERSMSKIHTMASKKKTSAHHPDGRAVIYEMDEMNKAKIQIFSGAIESMDRLSQAALTFLKEHPATPVKPLMDQLSSSALRKGLEYFKTSINLEKAKKTGTMDPQAGLSASYDDARERERQASQHLEEYLTVAKKEFGSNHVAFFKTSMGKDKVQLEILDSVRPPNNWEFVSKRKGFKRFVTKELRTRCAALAAAETAVAEAARDCTRQVFERFDEDRALWSESAKASAELDCLLSLALVSNDLKASGEACLPEFLDDEDAPRLELHGARHPCVAARLERNPGAFTSSTFIPNDTLLGVPSHPVWGGTCMLLTGPNMGGKSTLLRQTSVAIIMAQTGCFVAASACRLTVCDRLFTRVGAADRILKGESTFFVELNECATILRHATKDSFVILDELGRGTSTFDGTAIAHSVVSKLLTVGARCMFASHYHALVRRVGKDPRVSLGHMSCEASSENQDDVTFLYKLEPGASDKSYGLNVAKLAKVPISIVDRARRVSSLFESAFARQVAERLMSELRVVAQTAAKEESAKASLVEILEKARAALGKRDETALEETACV